MDGLTEMYCIVGQMGGAACFSFETVHFYVARVFWIFFSLVVLPYVLDVALLLAQSKLQAEKGGTE